MSGSGSSRSTLLIPAVLSAVVVAASAAAWLSLRSQQEPPIPVHTATVPPPAAPGPTATPAPGPVPAAPAALEPVKPGFDIVRVAPSGNAVLAGHAAPGAEVTLAAGGQEIGRTRADAEGNWVLVPAAPLPAGSDELAVSAQGAGGATVKGDAPVVVLVPQSTPGAPAAPKAPVAVALPPNAMPRVFEQPAAPGSASAAAPRGSALGLQVVDYDEHGQIRFGGTAPPNAALRLYIDNKLGGDARADAQGHWVLMPAAPVAIGEHRLRIDQLGPAGRVTARVELPFQRAVLSPQDVAEGKLVVQPTESLWRIARHAYGQGVRYTVIYEANRDQIRNPNLIYPGQIFTIPASPDGPR
jgi:nucleoid-associated protein YgaU